ncbi:MAG: ABC transporter substrate-binding protein [Gammaproteobacteria bacterium]
MIVLVLAGMLTYTWAFAAENIHIVSSRSNQQFSETILAFKQAVLEQRNDIHFIETDLSNNDTQSSSVDLEFSKTELIFTLGSQATKLVLSKQQSAPVVSSLILSENLLSQSSHATGIVMRYPMSVQLQWIKNVLPDVKRVGILYSPDKNSQLVAEAKLQADKMALKIVAIAVDNPRNLPAALDEMYRRSDVLMAIPDTAIYSGKTLKQVMLSSFRNRVPLVGLSRNWVKAGAIYAIEGDFKSIGVQSAELAESIMRNKKMPEGGFYFPNAVNLIVNEKTMRHMRRDIDSHIIDSAAHVYR